MAKLVFKGSMTTPKYEHGELIQSNLKGKLGVVMHRRYSEASKTWEYGLIIEGWPLIDWVRDYSVSQ